jgi:glycerate 2-kinase
MYCAASHMNLLIAPLELKGTLSAAEAADAIAEGLRAAGLKAELRCVPLADGGPGTLSAIAKAHTAMPVQVARVTASDGTIIDVPWMVSDDLAIIESAKAVGLTRIPEARRKPLIYSSRGVGEMIRAALDHGAKHIAVGIGGTGTVDLGLGCATALGVRFNDQHGRAVDPIPEHFSRLAEIDTTGRDRRLGDVTIEAWIDVQAPLTGAEGAAYRYGVQKGVPLRSIPMLDSEFGRIAASLGHTQLGDGAGGGLSWALRVFLGAIPMAGFEALTTRVGIIPALEWCDIAFTSEGRLDAQSLQGKGTWSLALEARRRDRPVVLFTGSSLLSADAWRPVFTDVVTLGATMPRDRDEAYERLVACVRSYALHGPLEMRPWL